MSAAPRDKIIPMLSKIIPGRTSCAVLAALALLTALAPAASAQSGWNRAVAAVSITPTAGGPSLWDVDAVVDVHLEESFTFPLDLSFVVELSVNGTVVASNTHTVGVDPGGSSCPDGAGCGGSCGSGAVDGQSAALLCVPAGPCNPLCDCHCAFPPITSEFPGIPMQTGDEIMVILYPAPMAMPDADTSDDQRMVTFEDVPVLWNHRLTNVELAPGAAGPGTWDVGVEGSVLFSGVLAFADPAAGTVPLSFEVELRIDGVPVSVQTMDFDPVPSGYYCGCGETCAYHNGFPLGCVLSTVGYCYCGWNWLTNFPGVPLEPGDEIMVLLRPAPGALPELPGLGGDDDMGLACCPGATGVGDAISIGSSGSMLTQNRPNPFEGSTTIGFAAAAGAHVTLEVFDILGRRVSTLVDGAHSGSAALRQVTWSGRTDSGEDAPAGIYFYRLTTDGRSETRKMTLTR